MARLADQVREAAGYIRGRDQRRPEVGLVLGSGLGQLAEPMAEATRIRYAEIPHFPHPSVAGHAGELIVGALSGKTVALLSGRVHFYEGYDLGRVTFPVRVLHALGCHTLVVTNAAGGLNSDFRAGDLMLIEDHINLVGLCGYNPLRGSNDPDLGPQFVNMGAAYDVELRRLALDVAGKLGLNLKHGIYAMVAGPTFETPAEIRFLRVAGADAVGMSTAAEVVVARQCGLRVLGISCIANTAIGDEHLHLTHGEVLQATQSAGVRLAELVRGILEVI